MTVDPPYPTLVGTASYAWLVDLPVMRKKCSSAESDATISLWLIYAPWAHPVWFNYALTTVHLRDIPDQDPIKVYVEGATHEFILVALNPDSTVGEQLENGLSCLLPPNFAAQMVCKDDAEAFARTKHAVEMICEGVLSPDTDFRSQWVELFGDNMVNEHYR